MLLLVILFCNLFLFTEIDGRRVWKHDWQLKVKHAVGHVTATPMAQVHCCCCLAGWMFSTAADTFSAIISIAVKVIQVRKRAARVRRVGGRERGRCGSSRQRRWGAASL
ncbi:hypothetical protein E2C01_099770 [Portunus trituberculatus]|uniref:Secreted protein n=1 Tax=Portunus trituberculatus TaxID=210409 RepID=A0A5B7KAE9_PORTR|nr:hypothetical protein [Portunus trituberculatus]